MTVSRAIWKIHIFLNSLIPYLRWAQETHVRYREETTGWRVNLQSGKFCHSWLWWPWAGPFPCLDFVLFILNHEQVRSVSKITLISFITVSVASIELEINGSLSIIPLYLAARMWLCTIKIIHWNRRQGQSIRIPLSLHSITLCVHIFLQMLLFSTYVTAFKFWTRAPYPTTMTFMIWFWFPSLLIQFPMGKVNTSTLCLTCGPLKRKDCKTG